MMMMVMP